jgi:hypothetical protein
MGEQVKAGIRAFMTAPVDLLAQGLGTAAPVILSVLGAKVLGAGALATKGVGLGLGAGMGSGIVKGTIYEETKQALTEAGMSEEQAEARAQLAQSYGGQNLDMILAGAALGGLASTTGIERALTGPLARNILSKAGVAEAAEQAAQQGLGRRVATGAVAEAIPEFLQAGQEQLAGNIALQREGFDVPTMRGVVGSATLEGLAGAGLGAGFGAIPSGTTGVQPPTPAREEPLPLRPEVESIPPEIPPVSTEVELIPPETVEADPQGRFSAEDIAATGVDIPAGNLPFVRRQVLGKTRSELEQFAQENPEVLEGEAPSARVIRALLEPAREPDQLGVEPPVPLAGPAVQPGAPGAVAPVGSGVADTGVDIGAPAVPAPSVTPAIETPRSDQPSDHYSNGDPKWHYDPSSHRSRSAKTARAH